MCDLCKMRTAELVAYPAYQCVDTDGRTLYMATCRAIAREKAAEFGCEVALEPRQDESALAPATRARIDAIYAAGC